MVRTLEAQDKYIEALQRTESMERRLRIEDTRYLTIALELSGERDRLEAQAADLVRAMGMRRSFQLACREGGSP